MWVRGLKLLYRKATIRCYHVAPHVGAWIETSSNRMLWLHTLSHPMWVRGLKHEASDFAHLVKTSHPMWVRGLKHG